MRLLRNEPHQMERMKLATGNPCCSIFTRPRVVVLALIATMGAPPPALAAWPPSKCVHVQVLGANDTDQISWEHDGGLFSDNSRLMDARPNQLDALGEALDMMPEVLCNAVQKVAFIYRPPEEGKTSVVDAWTKSNDRQNLVYLNTWDDLYWNQNRIDRNPSFRAAAIQRMIHESTHCAIRMIQSQQKAKPVGLLQQRPEESLWPARARKLAKDVITKNRLEPGVLREWQRMHDAFVAAGMSTAYWGKDWPKKHNMTAEEITNAGFTSAYGGEQAMEDIAEMASWAIVRGTAEDPEDAACRVMNRRSGSSISRDDAAVFTKLGFVRTLDFITEQQYKSCVGSLGFRTDGEGFYSYRVDDLSNKYTSNVKAGLGRPGTVDHIVFQLSAEGEVSISNAATGDSTNVPATVELLLNVSMPSSLHDPMLGVPAADSTSIDEVSFPRGVYFIGDRHKSKSRLRIRRNDNDNIIMDVSQGVALVGRASTQLVEGSVFLQRIFNFSGGLLSAVAGDEPIGEPFSMAFKFERSGGGECQPGMECEIP